jgi:DNA helicase-2/ATP-dependent DNA helicase PcrA
VTQNISGNAGLADWETLTGTVFGKHGLFYTLSKSYRNTIEISNYAALALRKLPAAKYPVEPIVRHATGELYRKTFTKTTARRLPHCLFCLKI